MKVSELYEKIQKLVESGQGDLVVIMSKDGEGNSYSPLASTNDNDYSYIPDSTWSGEIMVRKLTPELIAEGYEEGDSEGFDEAVEAVILWPTN